jgi:putative addiction module component (TIGR02574 family)
MIACSPFYGVDRIEKWKSSSFFNSLLGVGPQRLPMATTLSARLRHMSARVDRLLDEVLELSPEDRSALAVALIDSLESCDQRAVSEAWRAELLLRRDRLRAGEVKAAPWAEARARMLSL